MMILKSQLILIVDCKNFRKETVMVRIRPERFSQGSAKKLQARSAGPFKILQRIGSNTYRIALPPEMGINPTFNVEDLVLPPIPIIELSSLSWPFSDFATQPLPPPITHKEEIEEILGEEIIFMRGGSFQRYIVKWKNKPPSESMWLIEVELQSVNPDLLDRHMSFNSPESSSTQTRSMMRTSNLQSLLMKKAPTTNIFLVDKHLLRS